MPERTPSKRAEVHRMLKVTDPPQEGRDVANLQRAAAERLRARGITRHELPVPVHGHFTHATAVACVEASYWLGLRSDTYLHRENGGLTCSEGAQRIIRDPDTRDAQQRDRAKERAANLKDAPRYADQLRKDAAASPRNGARAALSFAEAQIGTTEQPPGSNWGPKISTWIKATGYTSPVPWCGCFVNACVIAAGVPSGVGWVGYTPAIVAHAKAGTDGWTWHGPSDGKPGDLALFDSGPGGDIAVHVGLVEKKLSDSSYQTIEGNTSSGSSGSQANGGGVFRRTRSTTGGFHIIGFARPPY